jgi:hypothetical protein
MGLLIVIAAFVFMFVALLPILVVMAAWYELARNRPAVEAIRPSIQSIRDRAA